MAYNGIRTRPERLAPQRRPEPRPAKPSDNTFEDDSFPDRYDGADSSGASIVESAILPRGLDAGLERLVDLAAGCIGCPPGEIADLKAAALRDPAAVASYCQWIFDQRIRPLREAPDPLRELASPEVCAFWLEGPQGRAVCTAPMTPALAPYQMAPIELHDPERTPFAHLGKIAAKR